MLSLCSEFSIFLRTCRTSFVTAEICCGFVIQQTHKKSKQVEFGRIQWRHQDFLTSVNCTLCQSTVSVLRCLREMGVLHVVFVRSIRISLQILYEPLQLTSPRQMTDYAEACRYVGLRMIRRCAHAHWLFGAPSCLRFAHDISQYDLHFKTISWVFLIQPLLLCRFMSRVTFILTPLVHYNNVDTAIEDKKKVLVEPIFFFSVLFIVVALPYGVMKMILNEQSSRD